MLRLNVQEQGRLLVRRSLEIYWDAKPEEASAHRLPMDPAVLHVERHLECRIVVLSVQVGRLAIGADPCDDGLECREVE